MKFVTIIGRGARFAAGTRLKLSADQAKRREGLVRKVGPDLYETTGPVEFKPGEVIGHDGDLPKSWASIAEPAPAAAKPSTPKKAPAKKTSAKGKTAAKGKAAAKKTAAKGKAAA